MKYILSIAIAVIGLLALFAAGCSKDTTTNSTQSFTLSPADNQTGVGLSTNVVLSLDKKINPTLVKNNFHLISETALRDSHMPGYSMMNHMTMMSVMDDASMMDYLDSAHSLHGIFMWNSDSTVCTFDPDSMFESRTQYMVHLDQPMIDMMEQPMGSMGMMGQNGTAQGTGMAFYFTTE